MLNPVKNLLSPARLVAPVLALATLALAVPAHASGFGVARFGGAHGGPAEYNAYSIYYNPAGLAGVQGYQLSLDVNWAYRTSSYTRPESAIDNPGQYDADGLAANSGEGTVSNFVYTPMVGFASDFGTELPFGVGAGFFVPFGGQSVWKQTDAPDQYPAAADGPNRWYVIEGTIRTLGFGIGGAYQINPLRLSVGLSVNLYLNEINTVRARTATGTDSLAAEGRSWVDVNSVDWGLGAGLLWEPIVDKLFLGVSYQSAPNFNGKLTLTGDLTNIFPPNDGSPNAITMTAQLPDIIRWGARWHHDRPATTERPYNPLYEVRISGDISRWSRLQNHCFMDNSLLGSADPYDFCAVNEDGSLVNADNAVIQNLARNWENAWGIRLGGSWWANPKVELIADLGYDTNAIPDATLEPALMDFNKLSVGLGGRFQVASFMHLGVLLTDVIYFERDTTGAGTQELSRPPSRQPSSEGIYTQNIFIIDTNVDFSF